MVWLWVPPNSLVLINAHVSALVYKSHFICTQAIFTVGWLRKCKKVSLCDSAHPYMKYVRRSPSAKCCISCDLFRRAGIVGIHTQYRVYNLISHTYFNIRGGPCYKRLYIVTLIFLVSFEFFIKMFLYT